MLQPIPRKGKPLDLLDMPRFVAEELELRGLNVPVEMIRGQSATTLEKLRDQGDRVQCPCLVLYQDEPLDFCTNEESATHTLRSLGRAARYLGCSELAIRSSCPAGKVVSVAATMKSALQVVQQFETNVLIRPMMSPIDSPEQVMELVKRIGGFHIGAMPSFAYAHASGEGLEALRKLAPYSAAIEVSSAGFNKQSESLCWDFDGLIEGLLSFGYLNKFSIDWVGSTNWVTGVQKTRERLMSLMGREDPAA